MHVVGKSFALGVGALAPLALANVAHASADTCATFTTSPRCFFVKTDLNDGLKVTKVSVESNMSSASYVRFVGVQPGGPTKYSAVFVLPPKTTSIACAPTVVRLPCGSYKDKTTLKMQSATATANGWVFSDIDRQNVLIHK